MDFWKLTKLANTKNIILKSQYQCQLCLRFFESDVIFYNFCAVRYALCTQNLRLKREELWIKNYQSIEFGTNKHTGRTVNDVVFVRMLPLGGAACVTHYSKNSTLLQKWHITPKMTHFSKNSALLQK